MAIFILTLTGARDVLAEDFDRLVTLEEGMALFGARFLP